MKPAITVLFIAQFALAVTCVAAEKEKPLPKDLPLYGELKPYRPPAVTIRKLQNGLTLWLTPVRGFPKVTFALAVRGGYEADPKERPGISELLASTVTQGTATRTARQIAEELQSYGGDLNARTQTDDILLETSVLREKAENAMTLLAEVARNAAFAEQEVESGKQKATSELDAQEAEPRFLGRRALYHAIFGNHPYSVIAPTKESIQKTTAAELKTEYIRRFRPDDAILVAVGDFDANQLERAAAKEFGSWKKPATPSDNDVPAPAPQVSKTIFYVDRPDSVQTAFFVAALAPKRSEPDHEAVLLANAIYGGMFGSRLIVNIREDKGYTYSPSSLLSSYRETGLFVTSASVRNPVTGASLNEISYELNRMGTTTPDREELERAKRFSIGRLAIGLQSQTALAQTLARYWIDSATPDDLAQESGKIDQVSAEQVREAGRKYFPMWRMTTVAVGEEKVIKEELSPFGLEFKKLQ